MRKRRIVCPLLAAIIVGGALASARAEAPALPSNLSERQHKADSDKDNWLLYGRNYKAWRYSPLTQINKENVKNLAVAWQQDTGMHEGFETTPIVVDGTMYYSTPWNNIIAVDAATGKQYWRYAYQLSGQARLCCDAVNRGVGIGNGKVISTTVDAYILALDARTGKELWKTQVADAELSYTETLAPQIIGNKAIIGISGGDYGIRGFIDAYDIDTGKRVWRWYTIPGPGEPGHDTWEGDSWKTGGGSQWMTCTYDPDTETIFAGIGNPGPDLYPAVRKGDNLYTDSVVALDVNTGKLKWHYQTIPHDAWDYDATACPVIDDITIDGKKRKVVMFSTKNGYFYVVDRTNGKPIYALKVCHKVNWGYVSEDGVPHPEEKMYPEQNKGTILFPGASGGKEWCNVAYDPVRKRIFIPLSEWGFIHTMIPEPYRPGQWYWGGKSSQVFDAYGHVTAVDVEKKKIAWDKRTGHPQLASISCTASGLVITGNPNQKMMILDADNGDELYSFQGLSGWHAGAVSYAVDGKQYIAFANGWGGPITGKGWGMVYEIPRINTMYVFALPEAKTRARPAQGASQGQVVPSYGKGQ